MFTMYIKHSSPCYSCVVQALGLGEAAKRPVSNLDDFTSLLGLHDARMLVDLLKLAVAKRVGPGAKETIATILISKLHNRLNILPQIFLVTLIFFLHFDVEVFTVSVTCLFFRLFQFNNSSNTNALNLTKIKTNKSVPSSILV